MLKNELHCLSQYINNRTVPTHLNISVILAFLGFIYYYVRHRQCRKDAETHYGLIVTTLAFGAAILLYVRMFFIGFWFKHYIFYLFLKWVTFGLIFPMIYYIVKGISEEKKEKKGKEGKGLIRKQK